MDADGYTDYSCSTSIERLARDIETILQSWHIVDGSDRHVSLQEASASPVLHSQTLSWELTFVQHLNRLVQTVKLELVLWDGPGHDENDDLLPYSMQIPPPSSLPLDLFGNFSALFGIGQHVTLTPVSTDLSDSIWAALAETVRQRYEDTASVNVVESQVQAILSSWLQTALNLAATHKDCAFPLFGIWGHYRQRAFHSNSMVPWLLEDVPLPKERVFGRRRRQACQSHYLPPVLHGALWSEDCHASFSCSLVPFDKPLYLSTLGLWMQQDRVALWGARSQYVWQKHYDASFPDTSWREMSGGSEIVDLSLDADAIQKQLYQQECRRMALVVLENAWGSNLHDPLWGPPDDPVASLQATVTWNGLPNDQNSVDPLLTLPLKVRSRNMSQADWTEMQISVERMILDPHRPTHFWLQVNYDVEAAAISLTATQRCVLAALIRCATLPPESLCSHVRDPALMETWDAEAGNEVALALADEAGVGPTTAALVAAMDWTHSSEDMIPIRRAEEVVRQVFESVAMFPISPDTDDEVFAIDNPLLLPLSKAAPASRFLSLLGVQMARVRSPSSMALVWGLFVRDLRSRWDNRESLPNQQRVPGLDGPMSLVVPKHVQSLGTKAHGAGAIHSSEPDPDDSCLIGQKLQVFNICVERTNLLVAEQLSGFTQEEKRPRLNINGASSKADSDAQPRMAFDSGNGEHGPSHSGDVSESEDEFFDAETSEQPTSASENDREHLAKDESLDSSSLLMGSSSLLLHSVERSGLNRTGARCPVPNATLKSNGAQVFAPFLQRSVPLTDDVIAARRLLIVKQSESGKASPVSLRFEVARHFQEPKLLSDMQAFKAANPGADFQDFISWYGNPANPLEECDETEELQAQNRRLGIASDVSADGDSSTSQSSHDGSPMPKKSRPDRKPVGTREQLDKAAEAIKVLKEFREFWSDTWKKAEPLPADEQRPLFDPESTLEMVLDYFETIHPANLMCQIMAVNLASAYFALAFSASEASGVETVRQAMTNLRGEVENALRLLSLDAVTAMVSQSTTTSSAVPCCVTTVESISACERACVALGEAEVVLMCALSLINKFGDRIDLVETILRCAEGEAIEITDEETRATVLYLIASQDESLESPFDIPTPAVREFLLRGVDSPTPCQLCVRYKQHGDAPEGSKHGWLALATTRCSID